MSINDFVKKSLQSVNYHVGIPHRVVSRPVLLSEGKNLNKKFPLFKSLPENSLCSFFNLLKNVIDVLIPHINEARILYIKQCREFNQMNDKLKDDSHLSAHAIITKNRNFERRISLMRVFYLWTDIEAPEDSESDVELYQSENYFLKLSLNSFSFFLFILLLVSLDNIMWIHFDIWKNAFLIKKRAFPYFYFSQCCV